MKPNINKDGDVEYLIQLFCMDCKSTQTRITNDVDFARMTKKDALMYGPCRNCKTLFLRVVGI